MVRAAVEMSDHGRPGAERFHATELRVAGLTDIGPTRRSNEDQYFVASVRRTFAGGQTHVSSWPTSGPDCSDVTETLMIVADGMGGYAGGELASSLVTRTIANHLLRSLGTGEDVTDRMTAAFQRSHRKLQDEARERPDVDPSFGTTVTVAYVAWPTLFVAHVGDSRCSLVRRGRVLRLTKDHTVAERMRDSDVLGHGETPARRFEHILTNAVGGNIEPRPDTTRIELLPGDVIVLSTDGATRALKDAEVVRILRQSSAPPDACARLIDVARNHGSKDNATAIVAQVV